MDPEDLVRRAAQGDVRAFVDLTRRFQHAAFGSALALLRDFQQAEVSVVSQELVQRLSGGADRVSLFTFIQRWRDAPPGWSFTQSLKEEGYGEGTVGAVQTFFLHSGEGPECAVRPIAKGLLRTRAMLRRGAVPLTKC